MYEARANSLSDFEGGIVTHKFVEECADYLEANEALDIRTAGFTKYPFPLLTKRYVFWDDDSLHVDLSSSEPIDT